MTKANEFKMFGMTTDDIREQYMNPVYNSLVGSNLGVVSGILSDCQEMMSYTNDASYKSTEESVRQQLNVAKFVLFEMMQVERTREALETM